VSRGSWEQLESGSGFIVCDRGRPRGPRSLPGDCTLCGGRGCWFRCTQCNERVHVPNPPGLPLAVFARRRNKGLEHHRASHQLDFFGGKR